MAEPQTKDNVLRYVQVIAPNLYADENIGVFCDMAIERCSKTFFGNLWNQATAYLTCHLITMAKRDSDETGSISSKHEGNLSVTYNSVSAYSDGEFSLTTYGRNYLTIKNSRKSIFVTRKVEAVGGVCFDGRS